MPPAHKLAWAQRQEVECQEAEKPGCRCWPQTGRPDKLRSQHKCPDLLARNSLRRGRSEEKLLNCLPLPGLHGRCKCHTRRESMSYGVRDVIRKPDARLLHRGVFVVESGLIESPSDAGERKLVDALRPHVGLPRHVRQLRVDITGMAKRVVGRTQILVAEANIHSQRLADPIIILCKPGVAGNAIVVVAQASSAFAEERRPRKKALKISRQRRGR